MTRGTPSPVEPIESKPSNWNWLYRVSGGAALVMAVLIPIQIVIFIAWPPPGSVVDYFKLFQHNRLLGLLDLDLLLIVDNLLSIPLYLSLFIALRRKNGSFMAIGATLGFLSIILYLVSRETTFSMLTLSDQYTAAATDGQRQVLLAVGQMMLTTYNGTVFNISYILGAAALILVSAVMLQNNLFNKATAYLGLVANILALGLYIPSVGIYVSVFSVVFLWIWDILIAIRMFQLGSSNKARFLPQA